jgi:hypothetical protein
LSTSRKAKQAPLPQKRGQGAHAQGVGKYRQGEKTYDRHSIWKLTPKPSVQEIGRNNPEHNAEREHEYQAPPRTHLEGLPHVLPLLRLSMRTGRRKKHFLGTRGNLRDRHRELLTDMKGHNPRAPSN